MSDDEMRAAYAEELNRRVGALAEAGKLDAYMPENDSLAGLMSEGAKDADGVWAQRRREGWAAIRDDVPTEGGFRLPDGSAIPFDGEAVNRIASGEYEFLAQLQGMADRLRGSFGVTPSGTWSC